MDFEIRDNYFVPHPLQMLMESLTILDIGGLVWGIPELAKIPGGNGETILSSEMYVAKSSAQSGIESVIVNSQNDDRFDRKTSSNGQQYYFVLKAGNNETIGKSEMYNSKQAMENGIASVKNNAPTATIDDQTM